jgi:hypothetical protein
VSASKQRELEREANVGEGIVAAASRKTKNEDPLPCKFLMTKISKLIFCQTLSNLEITVFINFRNA